jgi:hypothetical protein
VTAVKDAPIVAISKPTFVIIIGTNTMARHSRSCSRTGARSGVIALNYAGTGMSFVLTGATDAQMAETIGATGATPVETKRNDEC